MKSILFAGSEAVPFIKSGGLADVLGSLPKELSKKKMDVRVVIPMYLKVSQKYKEKMSVACSFPIIFGDYHTQCTIYQKQQEGVLFYFVEHRDYFERDGLYGYQDDAIRFAFFQKSVLDMLYHLDFYPDVIHSHDWHTGMIPFLCRHQYGSNEKYRNIKHVYTIHNLAYQGNFSKEVLSECFDISQQYFLNGALRLHNGISFMKAGIVYADKVTTVSCNYAKEILTPQYGEQLDQVLKFREYDLSGIVNGIDIDLWNPKTDETLERQYSLKTVTKGKLENKLALQKQLGLRVSKDVMLVGMVSRLTWQKGVYLMIERLADIMGQDIQLVILGTGEEHVENQFKHMEGKYKGRAVYYCGYSEEVAHKIYAASDVFLMPSLFEPCGISQLIAMRYGTLPLVRETGGLKDTVLPYNKYTKEGTGFSFSLFSSHDMLFVLKMAVDLYYKDQVSFKQLIKQAMKTDVSWSKSACEYLELYRLLTKKAPV